MARSDSRIVFAASISRVTGDGEQVTVNFNGGDQGELRARLYQAARVLDEHVQKHNKKVLDVTEEAHRTLEAARDRIRREQRQELADAGLIPHALVDAAPLVPKEANGGTDPAGPADLRSDS